jgi:peptidoglycan/LPS O-acetylase OafA/YrhL
LDLVAGLTAGLGGVVGLVLAVLAGILGLIAAAQRQQYRWLALIAAAGGLVIVGLGLAAFFLLGAARNPFHPFVLALLVPLTTLVYSMAGEGSAQQV